MPDTDRRPARAHVWALGWALLPVLAAVAAAFAVAAADDGSCEGFSCPSFGAAILAVYAVVVAAPVVAVCSQLATLALRRAHGLREHPAALGLLAALASWLVFAAGTAVALVR